MSDMHGTSNQAPAGTAFGVMMKRRHPAAVFLLPVVTVGIYGLVWYYKIQKEMGAFDRRIDAKPLNSLLALVPGALLIVPAFVTTYGTGKRIAQAQRAAGLQPTCSPGLGILLGIFGFMNLYYQIELNKAVDRYPGVEPGAQVQLAA